MELFEKKFLKFDEIINYDKTKEEGLVNNLELLFYDLRDIKGKEMDPLPKQSVRMVNHSHHKDMRYDYAYRGPVKKGDVKLFIDKKTNTRNVINTQYTPAKIRHYENMLKSRAMEQLPSGFKMFETAVFVEQIVFGFSFLSNHSQKIKSSFNSGIAKIKLTKPDLIENLNKPVWDALEGVVFSKDSIIGSAEKMIKIYAPKSYIYIKLRGF